MGVKNYRSITIALLTGFMLGSLNKVWPWKETVSTRINSKGEEVPFLQNNTSPFEYSEIYQTEHQLVFAIVMLLVGFGLVFAIEKIGTVKSD